MTSLINVTKQIIDMAVEGVTPNVGFDKEMYKDYIYNSTCTQPTAMEEFHMAMGCAKETADEALTWWRDATVYTENIFPGIDIRFFGEEVQIGFIECKKYGYFFLFWETLKKVCRHYGVKEITLCNRASEGFWAAQGFTGPDHHMTFVV